MPRTRHFHPINLRGTQIQETVYNKVKGKQDKGDGNQGHPPSQSLGYPIPVHDHDGTQTEGQNNEDDDIRIIHPLHLLKGSHHFSPLIFPAFEIFFGKAVLSPVHQGWPTHEGMGLFTPLVGNFAKNDVSALNFDRHHVPLVFFVYFMFFDHMHLRLLLRLLGK